MVPGGCETVTMRRFLATLFLLCLCTAAAPAQAAAIAPARVVSLRAGLEACETGSAKANRFAVFTASMPRVRNAERMELRFDFLQRRPGDNDFVKLAVPKLGVWERAQPRVPAFLVEKRVNELAAPADYRVLVRFRWFAADGRVVRRSERRSKVCRQPDPRPDLIFESVTTRVAANPQRARYDVVVRNTGRGDALASAAVSMMVGGQRVPIQALSSLGAGESETVSFDGPRCTGETRIDLSLDVAGAVEEAGEANNTLSLPCAATLARS